MSTSFTIGIDYGTNSVRAVVVDCADGSIRGAHVFAYPSGDDGVLLEARDPHLARQNPGDYIEALRVAVPAALAAADATPGFARARVIGIGVDTTGSTPLPVDANNRPLGLDPRWQANLAAHAWLWKDHTSADEAAAITRAARADAPYLLAPIGGTYSSEWFWAKIWHCLNVAPDVFAAAESWVELADFVPAVLAGVEAPRDIQRSICAAGHKALYSDEWGGLPPHAFLAGLHPELASLRDRLYSRAYPADRPAGQLARHWADTFGLRAGIPIAMGAFDAHYGAVGSGIKPGTFVKIIGTSTCDCATAPLSTAMPDIPGICGIVPGSIMPGYYGIEAGQSAVGDLLRWWVDEICLGDSSLHDTLSADASRLRPGESGLLALDWNNGNRTVLVDPRLTGLLVGQTLHTTRAEVYRALIEATAFGARTIVARLKEYGVPIDRIVCCGGIAERNPLFMQIYADAIGVPMHVAGSSQAPALGAAISAAVAAGAQAGGFDTFDDAQARMTMLAPHAFQPDPQATPVYDELYALYRELHDGFGGVAGAHTDYPTLMKRLLAIRERAVAAARPMAGQLPTASASRVGA
jgi:L-ribulokinase